MTMQIDAQILGGDQAVLTVLILQHQSPRVGRRIEVTVTDVVDQVYITLAQTVLQGGQGGGRQPFKRQPSLFQHLPLPISIIAKVALRCKICYKG